MASNERQTRLGYDRSSAMDRAFRAACPHGTQGSDGDGLLGGVQQASGSRSRLGGSPAAANMKEDVAE